jgi:hypothetical protein
MKSRCPKCRSTNVSLCERRPGLFDNFRWSWLGRLDCFYRWKSRSEVANSWRSTTAEDKARLEAALKRKTTKRVCVNLPKLIAAIDTAPAAIRELFCKVYNIKEEK